VNRNRESGVSEDGSGKEPTQIITRLLSSYLPMLASPQLYGLSFVLRISYELLETNHAINFMEINQLQPLLQNIKHKYS
jgi:hypothetical protein